MSDTNKALDLLRRMRRKKQSADAAPNLRRIPGNYMNPNAGSRQADITYEELKALHTGRIQRIFEIAMENSAQVLILGAFGCGAFCNHYVAFKESMERLEIL